MPLTYSISIFDHLLASLFAGDMHDDMTDFDPQQQQQNLTMGVGAPPPPLLPPTAALPIPSSSNNDNNDSTSVSPPNDDMDSSNSLSNETGGPNSAGSSSSPTNASSSSTTSSKPLSGSSASPVRRLSSVLRPPLATTVPLAQSLSHSLSQTSGESSSTAGNISNSSGGVVSPQVLAQRQLYADTAAAAAAPTATASPYNTPINASGTMSMRAYYAHPLNNLNTTESQLQPAHQAPSRYAQSPQLQPLTGSSVGPSTAAVLPPVSSVASTTTQSASSTRPMLSPARMQQLHGGDDADDDANDDDANDGDADDDNMDDDHDQMDDDECDDQLSDMSPRGVKRRLAQFDPRAAYAAQQSQHKQPHRTGVNNTTDSAVTPRGSHGPRDELRYETWTSKQLRKKCSHLKLRGLKNVKKHVMVDALYRYYRTQRQRDVLDATSAAAGVRKHEQQPAASPTNNYSQQPTATAASSGNRTPSRTHQQQQQQHQRQQMASPPSSAASGNRSRAATIGSDRSLEPSSPAASPSTAAAMAAAGLQARNAIRANMMGNSSSTSSDSFSGTNNQQQPTVVRHHRRSNMDNDNSNNDNAADRRYRSPAYSHSNYNNRMISGRNGSRSEGGSGSRSEGGSGNRHAIASEQYVNHSSNHANEIHVTSDDVIRLVDVVLSPVFVDRLAVELSRWRFWVDVRDKYIASLRVSPPPFSSSSSQYGSASNMRQPLPPFKWSSMQLWEIWKELTFSYTKTCFAFTAAGMQSSDDRDYINYCQGRPDVYYLHQRLHARPDLLHLIKSNEYIEEKATSDASESISHAMQSNSNPMPLVGASATGGTGSNTGSMRSLHQSQQHKRFKRIVPTASSSTAAHLVASAYNSNNSTSQQQLPSANATSSNSNLASTPTNNGPALPNDQAAGLSTANLTTSNTRRNSSSNAGGVRDFLIAPSAALPNGVDASGTGSTALTTSASNTMANTSSNNTTTNGNSTENSETTGEDSSSGKKSSSHASSGSDDASGSASSSSTSAVLREGLAEQKFFGLLLQNFEAIFESLHNKKVLLAALRKDPNAPDQLIADLHDDIHVLSALKKEFRNKLRHTLE